MAGNRKSFVSDITAGDGKIANLFLQCIVYCIGRIHADSRTIGHSTSQQEYSSLKTQKDDI
jgi:hypothetical protein